MAELSIPPREAAGWSDVGFGPVDTIVEYEKRGPSTSRSGAAAPRSDATTPTTCAPFWRSRHARSPGCGRTARPSWRTTRDAPETELWVLEVDRALVGYVGLTIRGDHGHLDRLAVDPDRRRGGLGSALVAHALDRFAAHGVRRVTLTTQHDNLRAQPIYRRFGFRPTGGQLTIYGRWLGRPRDRTP